MRYDDDDSGAIAAAHARCACRTAEGAAVSGPSHVASSSSQVSMEDMDKALEVAMLLRSSEAGYTRDHRDGTAFGARGDDHRLEAFTLGVLDSLAQVRIGCPYALELLVYLRALIEHGPGGEARAEVSRLLDLHRSAELRRYVAGGRRLARRMLAGRDVRPGVFAELLEEELKQA